MLPSNSWPLSVLFPSDFFIKTLYTPKPNRHINNILPSHSRHLSVLFLQISSSKKSTHLAQITTLIITSHHTLGTLSVLIPSDFFTKTLYTPRPNRHFNNILPSKSGTPKCSLTFRFIQQNTLHT